MNQLSAKRVGQHGASQGAVVVDLDGPLIQSGIRGEIRWARFAADSGLDPELLPYDAALVGYIGSVRAEGFRTVLVFRGPEATAQAIADHLGLFDVVLAGPDYHGSETLDARLGSGAYAFGDGTGPNGTPKRRTFDFAAARALLLAMRPHQWLKNLLVFVPVFTAHALTTGNLLAALAAFVAFSLTASSVYLVNDLVDLPSDRAHARKRLRPFASGRVLLDVGTVAAPLLLLAGGAIAALVSWPFFGVLLVYFAVTLAYSFALKRKAILDICVLAGLYTLRIVAGGAAVGLPISVWLLAFSIFFFLALASIKRQAELVDARDSGKLGASGRDYVVDDIALVSQMAISASYVSVLVMALYVNTDDVTRLYRTPETLWGICLILLYWLSRAVWKAHRGEMHDDPTVFALKDGISRVAILLVLACGVIGALA
ncbi:MAG: UbiA family prenyltransferase [Pseudomonadota bacterium]